MAVIRNKKINFSSDEIKLACSFSVVDVKDLLKMYADLLEKNGIRDSPDDEKSIRHWLEHDGRAFLSWPQKWREQLSGWCFATAVRNKLLLPTATDPNKYYLADCLFVKRGRPKNKEE